METVLSPLVKRFSQPIILSFALAWIVWNWEIALALIWYNQETIKKLGSDDYVLFINNHRNPWNNYFWPAVVAFSYPIVILLANNFNALIKKYDYKLFVKISQDANVSTDRYLKAKDDLEEKAKRISKFIDKEAEMTTAINDLTISKNELLASEVVLKNENIELNSSLATLNFENTNLKIDIDLTYKLNKLDWFVGEGTVELVEIDPRKTMRSIMFGTYEVIERDGKYMLNIINKSGSVGFIISLPMFNPVTRTLQISIENIGNNYIEGMKNDTLDILFFVIFRDFKEKTITFRVIDGTNTFVSVIESGDTKYELEMKTPTIK